MELEELKNSWTALNDRLKKSEALTESIIIEMAQLKTKKSINKLIYYGISGIILILYFTPTVVSSYYEYHGLLPLFDIMKILIFISLIIGLIGEVYKITLLKRINFSKEVSYNIYNVNRYYILTKYEKVFLLIVMSVIAMLTIASYVTMKANMILWMTGIGVILVMFSFSYWYYKSFHKKCIQPILDNLNELKEKDNKK